MLFFVFKTSVFSFRFCGTRHAFELFEEVDLLLMHNYLLVTSKLVNPGKPLLILTPRNIALV